MKLGEVNDLGLGYCAVCKTWKELPSLHPKHKHKPRNERPRICGKCYAALKRIIEPFFFAKKAIAAHKSMAKEGDYTIVDIKELHKWQAFYCPYCNSPMHYSFTIEHVIPREEGGRNILSNILLICSECNSSKQNIELIHWLEKKKYTIKPKILAKIKGAYHEHGFIFKGDCQHCTGTTNKAICNPGTKSCIK